MNLSSAATFTVYNSSINIEKELVSLDNEEIPIKMKMKIGSRHTPYKQG